MTVAMSPSVEGLRGEFGGALVLVLIPFLLYTALVPVLGRSRIDRLSSRARRVADLDPARVPAVDQLSRLVPAREPDEAERRIDGRALAPRHGPSRAVGRCGLATDHPLRTSVRSASTKCSR